MYVAVKGGEKAIDNAHAWLSEERRGDLAIEELSSDQIKEQLSLAVNRVPWRIGHKDLDALTVKFFCTLDRFE